MVIKNGYIITMDDDKIIRGGYVVTDGRKITYVGESLPMGIDTTKVIDARGGIVMPGLINAHTHSAMSLMRGFADDMPLYAWLCDKIFPAEEKLDSEAAYYGALLACSEMIKGGTTVFSDMYFMMESSAKAVAETGIKANLAPYIVTDEADYSEKLAQAESFFDEFNGAQEGNIKVDYSLHAIYSCSPKVLEEVATAAREKGAGLCIHLSETAKENEDCRRECGMSPTQLLEKTGFLYEKTNLAHCVYLSDDDMDIIKKYNATAVHNPVSNLKFANGTAKVQKMIDKGINVAIGTDGAAANNSLDMFEEMKYAALLAKNISSDPTQIDAKTALYMATSGGARALGREEETGKIKEGMDADILILDADAPNLCPVYDPVSAAVYSAKAGNVDTTIIAGNIVMEKKEFVSIDMERVKREVKKSVERMGL